MARAYNSASSFVPGHPASPRRRVFPGTTPPSVRSVPDLTPQPRPPRPDCNHRCPHCQAAPHRPSPFVSGWYAPEGQAPGPARRWRGETAAGVAAVGRWCWAVRGGGEPHMNTLTTGAELDWFPCGWQSSIRWIENLQNLQISAHKHGYCLFVAVGVVNAYWRVFMCIYVHAGACAFCP